MRGLAPPSSPNIGVRVACASDRISRRGRRHLVFGSEVGAPFDPSKMGRGYKAALSAARSSRSASTICVTPSATLGVQVWERTRVQGYMGHTDIQTTLRYPHHQLEHDDAHKLSALIQREVSPALSIQLGTAAG
jgi:integrase